ncbi:MAG: sigma-70 family RNA polymerase sigma factor [Bacteroidota bacterium]
MNTQLNSKYLKGIKENNFSVLQEIYRESLPQVAKYIKKNSGELDDAKDVFQEGILVVFRKVQNDELELTTDFHYYLFGVCKKIWLKKLKKKNLKRVPFEDLEVSMMEDPLEIDWDKSQKWTLFNRQFERLSEECRKVLKMLFNKKSGKEIAAAMGYSEDYAKRKKYKCKNKLADLIRSSPEYKSLTQ